MKNTFGSPPIPSHAPYCGDFRYRAQDKRFIKAYVRENYNLTPKGII